MIRGAGDVIGKPAPRQARMSLDPPSTEDESDGALEPRLQAIRQRIAAACVRGGRDPAQVQLVAVSKTFHADLIATAADCGQEDFGESYIQEALPKIGLAESLAGRPLRWHFIGPIQGNKTGAIASVFAWAHGVDRLKIAQRLSTAQRPADYAPLQVCVQVNVSGEASKSGCAPEEAPSLCAEVAALPGLQLRGLMCIPEAADDPEQSRRPFALLRELHARIRAAGAVDPALFDQLSMGMSDDFETAIEEGATIIRVGSAIFGSRPRKPIGQEPGEPA
jgi:pyridoxal phosphate enzyme (YggS family)